MPYTEILIDTPPFDPTTHRIDRVERIVDDEAQSITTRAIIVPLSVDERAAIDAANADLLAAAAATLSAARMRAVADNNAWAGKAREAYLTAVPGQSSTYAAKQGEADRWTAAGQPAEVEATAYPWAADRADLMGVAITDVLAEWSAVAAAWGIVGRRIERERERVNQRIADAASQSEIRVAADSADYRAEKA
jgi:hypothetical protein